MQATCPRWRLAGGGGRHFCCPGQYHLHLSEVCRHALAQSGGSHGRGRFASELASAHRAASTGGLARLGAGAAPPASPADSQPPHHAKRLSHQATFSHCSNSVCGLSSACESSGNTTTRVSGAPARRLRTSGAANQTHGGGANPTYPPYGARTLPARCATEADHGRCHSLQPHLTALMYCLASSMGTRRSRAPSIKNSGALTCSHAAGANSRAAGGQVAASGGAGCARGGAGVRGLPRNRLPPIPPHRTHTCTPPHLVHVGDGRHGPEALHILGGGACRATARARQPLLAAPRLHEAPVGDV